MLTHGLCRGNLISLLPRLPVGHAHVLHHWSSIQMVGKKVNYFLSITENQSPSDVSIDFILFIQQLVTTLVYGKSAAIELVKRVMAYGYLQLLFPSISTYLCIFLCVYNTPGPWSHMIPSVKLASDILNGSNSWGCIISLISSNDLGFSAQKKSIFWRFLLTPGV